MMDSKFKAAQIVKVPLNFRHYTVNPPLCHTNSSLKKVASVTQFELPADSLITKLCTVYLLLMFAEF